MNTKIFTEFHVYIAAIIIDIFKAILLTCIVH